MQRERIFMSFFRPTWAEINLKNIKFNFKSIKHILPAGVHTMAVVKANAYGHGSIPVSKTLETQGVNYLGVATLDEALEIKKRGIKCPMLILGSILPQEAEIAAKNNITITLCNIELLKKIEKNQIALYNVLLYNFNIFMENKLCQNARENVLSLMPVVGVLWLLLEV